MFVKAILLFRKENLLSCSYLDTSTLIGFPGYYWGSMGRCWINLIGHPSTFPTESDEFNAIGVALTWVAQQKVL